MPTFLISQTLLIKLSTAVLLYRNPVESTEETLYV